MMDSEKWQKQKQSASPLQDRYYIVYTSKQNVEILADSIAKQSTLNNDTDMNN